MRVRVLHNSATCFYIERKENEWEFIKSHSSCGKTIDEKNEMKTEKWDARNEICSVSQPECIKSERGLSQRSVMKILPRARAPQLTGCGITCPIR